MNSHPVRRARHAPSETGEKAAARIEHDSRHPFFSFRYSYLEIVAEGRSTRVRAKRARYEDGKLTSEAFEGELDSNLHERTVGEAQRFFLEQATSFARLAAAFLASAWKRY